MSSEKKLSTQELIRQQLEKKKQAQSNGSNKMNGNHAGGHKMKSQQTKKPSNTRRKMGS